jgi:oligoendopeptidase F
MTTLDETLPRWSVADVHESLDARSFTDALERVGADVDRLVALFDELGIRAIEPRAVDAEDAAGADRALSEVNRVTDDVNVLRTYVYATVATDSRDQRAQAVFSEVRQLDAALSADVAAHHGPLTRLAARADHQMTEAEEHLAAELSLTGSGAWARLHADVTSQLTAEVALPGGVERLPMPAVRGLANDPDPDVRRAAHDAELTAWPTVEVPVAAALNAIKGEAHVLNRRRAWNSPLDASLFANSVGRPTFEAMQSAVVDALPDLRRWMKVKAALHGHDPDVGLPWWDLVAPLPFAGGAVSWDDGIDVVRTAFSRYSAPLGGLVDRALSERWIDAEPRPGKTGGAFCARFVDDRSLVLLNWSGSADSTQTTAHELGHAYHDGARRDRQHLLRDARRRSRPGALHR